MLYWRHCFYDRCGLGQRSVCSIGTPTRSPHIHHHRHHHAIIIIIIKSHFPHHTIIFGSSKTSRADLLKFIAMSNAISFAVSTIEIEGEGEFRNIGESCHIVLLSIITCHLLDNPTPSHISPARDL